MLVEQLADLLETTRVKAVYLVPTFGNPGGKTLSEDRRRRLVELAKKHDFVIIEDDPYGEISFTDEVRRPLYQHAVELGCEDQVVYTSTFSKILAPGMRIGWIVMPDWLAQQTVIVKQAADLHTNMLSQVITAEYLAMNRLDNQIALIREIIARSVWRWPMRWSRDGEHIAFSRPKAGCSCGLASAIRSIPWNG
jgi:DNA-binding transcriptional MocR family regulator